MTKEITDKNFVVMLKGGYKCYLTDKQSEALKQQLMFGIERVLLDDYYFKSDDISYIIPAKNIDREDKVRRGEWRCSFNHWHGRNEECGHVDLERMNK